MTTIFDEWTIAEAKKRLEGLTPKWALNNLKFYEGDHLNRFEFWSGPLVDSTDGTYTAVTDKIKRVFVSRNVIKEISERHIVGVVGKRPSHSVGLVDHKEEMTEAEQALITEAEDLLSEWLNGQQGFVPRKDGNVRKTGVHQVTQSGVASTLLARRGPLRLHVTPAALTTNEAGQTAVTVDKPLESIRKIFVTNPPVNQAAVVVDSETMTDCGVYNYKVDRDEFVELTYLDDEGQTVIAIAASDGSKTEWRLPLNGRLIMYDMERDELITEQVRQLQMALNKTLTMQAINMDLAGFRERGAINAQRPGSYIPDPDDPTREILDPDDINLGPATFNFFTGIELINQKTGERTLTNPTLFVHEPSSPQTFIDTSDNYYACMLNEADQIHHLIAGDAVASGVSRETAKGDFKASLELTKPVVESALRWMLETVLAMTAVLSGQPGRYDGLSVEVQCRLDLGDASVDDIRATGEARDKGLISLTTAVSRAGVDDPQAEIALIEQETAAQLTILEKQATVMKLLMDAGATVEGAAQAVGIDEEIAQRLAGRRLIPTAVPVNGVVT